MWRCQTFIWYVVWQGGYAIAAFLYLVMCMYYTQTVKIIKYVWVQPLQSLYSTHIVHTDNSECELIMFNMFSRMVIVFIAGMLLRCNKHCVQWFCINVISLVWWTIWLCIEFVIKLCMSVCILSVCLSVCLYRCLYCYGFTVKRQIFVICVCVFGLSL